ncbi:hypothetical protein MW887_005762, partial [Aspergillus wentii]
MGSFTIYCAGCAGPFTRPSLGSMSQKALARRRRMQRKLETGFSDAEDDEEGEEDRKEVGHEGKEEEEEDEVDEEYDEYDEDNSYDPEIFTEDNFNWLEYVVCLGFHKQAFLSGEGYYAEQGEIIVTQGDGTFRHSVDERTHFGVMWMLGNGLQSFHFTPSALTLGLGLGLG